MIRPLKDNVLIAQIKSENATASGIVLSVGNLGETKTAVVLAVGPEATGVEVDDVIIPEWSNASVVTVDGNARMMIKSDDIMMVLDK